MFWINSILRGLCFVGAAMALYVLLIAVTWQLAIGMLILSVGFLIAGLKWNIVEDWIDG